MCLQTILQTVATSVIFATSLGEVNASPAPPIGSDCRPPDTCANLYLFGEDDVPLYIAHGTEAEMGSKWPRGVEGVSKMQAVGPRLPHSVGEFGCYTIFEEKNFGPLSFCWENADMITIKEAGFEKSVIGYVSRSHVYSD